MLRLITFLCFTVACLDSVNSLQIHEKIYGGENASITEYPYQLSMQSNGVHNCGASIISVDWALTSAYCSGGSVGSISLRAGSTVAGSGGTVHTVAQKVIHAEYNSGFTDYDLALLRVSPPFVFGPDADFIDLPVQDQITEEGLDGIVSGWGKTETGEMSTVLQSVLIPVINDTACRAVYGFSAITERMICAGVPGGGVGACLGDFGGPMVVGTQLIGVTSWGRGCSEPNPGVFAKVSAMRDWIREQSGV